MKTELTNREIKMLIAVGIFLMAILFGWGVKKFRGYMEAIAEGRKTALLDKKSLYILGQEYHILQEMANSIANKGTNHDIAPDIESLLEKNGLKEKAVRLLPSTKVIENKYTKYQLDITLKDITSREILSLIKDIEEYQSVFIKIENFRSKPTYNKPGIYQCSLQAVTFGVNN